MTQPPPRLFVLPPSHYCERARWALDRMEISYVEEPWAVGAHVLQARRIAPRTTLPILRNGSEIIQGSGQILTWTKMTGADPIVEERFEKTIGVLLRQYIYAAVLSDPQSRVQDLLLDGISSTQARIGRLAWPVTRRLMIAGMNARPELVPELEQRLAAELDWFDALIHGKRYIVGDQLGRADITAASLLSPLARPAVLPRYRKTALPTRIEDKIAEWKRRPGLQWVENIYARHRH